jgi:hypothetical protein
MSKLTAATRNRLPASAFAQPGKRAFPMENKARAIAAKGRAKQQEKRGALSPGAYEAIVAKANRKLGK